MREEYSLYTFCQRLGAEKLLEEWDSEKNAPLTPEEIHKGQKSVVEM